MIKYEHHIFQSSTTWTVIVRHYENEFLSLSEKKQPEYGMQWKPYFTFWEQD